MISGTYQPRKLLGSNAQTRPYNGSNTSIKKTFKNDHEFMKAAHIRGFSPPDGLSTPTELSPLRHQQLE